MVSLFCLHVFVQGSECSSLGKKVLSWGTSSCTGLHAQAPRAGETGRDPGAATGGTENTNVYTYIVYLCIKMWYIDVYILTFILHSWRGETNQAKDGTPICVTAVYPLSVCLCNRVYHPHIYSVHTCLLAVQPDLGTQSHSSLTSLCLIDSAPPHSAHSWNATSPSECIWKIISIA